MSGAGVFSSAPAPAKKSGSIILGVTTSHEFEYLHFTENLSFYNKCTVILTFYTAANVHSIIRQLLRIIHTSLAIENFFM